MTKIKFGLWYDFRNPPQWHQNSTELYQNIFRQIERAEKLGWDEVWISEHHFTNDAYTPSVLTLAGAIATRTETMRVGTAALLLPLHDPVRVAEDAATIDVLSGGRLNLGLALGYRHEEYKGFGVDRSQRVARMEEGLQIVRQLLSGETVNWKSNHYNIEDAQISPLPVQKPIKLFVGATVEAAARRAARLGDALLGSGGDLELIKAYRDELTKLGKNPDEHEITSGRMWLIVSNNPEKRLQEARDHLSYQLDTYFKWFQASLPGTADAVQQFSTDDLLAIFRAQVVKPGQAIEIIEQETKNLGITSWYSWTLPPGLPVDWADEHIELMAKEVIPAFR